jgi:hypothetical protein
MRSFQAAEPMERVAVDILGPIARTVRENLYVVVLMDYFTKWVEIFPLPDQKAITVAACLVDNVFSRMGIPRQIHSDQGTDFMSKVFRATCKLLGVTQTRTTPWRPQSDGMVERMNRTLVAMLKQYANEDQGDWDLILPYCAAAYRSSIHTSTGFSPNMLMFGRETRMPIDLLMPHPEEGEEESFVSTDMYVSNLKERLRTAFRLARENLKKATSRQMVQYNRKASDRKFEPGDGIWLLNPKRKVGRSPKLDIPWEGPYTVIAILNDVLLEIQKSPKSKSRVVHQDKVVPVRGNHDGRWVFTLRTRDEPLVVDETLGAIRNLFDTPKDNIDGGVPDSLDVVDENSSAMQEKGAMFNIPKEPIVDLHEKMEQRNKWWKRVGHRLNRV